MVGKRIFDIILSFTLLTISLLPMFLLWIITTIALKSNGLFLQTRIGQHGKPFTMYKYKTLFVNQEKTSKWGAFLRKTKIDEFPQLVNILIGNMSFVGPRPDLPGYYDVLEGENRKILKLKPGITSEAALKYVNEEQLLASKENPKQYNDEIIFPDKIKMNLNYYHTRSFLVDLKILLKTVQKLVW
ncbi:sugar transferase [Kordia sp.]|uniref:sugar transferase n=1 Tax=Kordia sp. TaxID=1965332 RepID=UPI0025BD5D7C|nr:sugar transferase [Kordia sp.]MCH2193799.1 sugar transferase [Kordia sp.]